VTADLAAAEAAAAGALPAAAASVRAAYDGAARIVVSCLLASPGDAPAALAALRALPGCVRAERADGDVGTFVRAYFERGFADDPFAEAAADLMAVIRAENGGRADWGAETIGAVAGWLTEHGQDTEPDGPMTVGGCDTWADNE
jgi:hypothetical protein